MGNHENLCPMSTNSSSTFKTLAVMFLIHFHLLPVSNFTLKGWDTLHQVLTHLTPSFHKHSFLKTFEPRAN